MLLNTIRTIFYQELDTIYPKEEIDSFFSLFMEYYLGLNRFTWVLQPQYAVSKKEAALFLGGLERLKTEEPVQYILESTEFMDLPLKVNKHVLIPRPETEELVGWILDSIQHDTVFNEHEFNILDLGTGSGCIAIALAKTLPKAKVTALDISSKALELAKKNAQTNKVDVEFICADMLNLKHEYQFNLIVSNPPYVREIEKVVLKNNVLAYEPHIALFVPDNRPLKYYEAIVAFSKTNLKSGGKLFLEINQYLAEETLNLLKANDFSEVELRKDIFGNYRMLKGTTF